MELTTLSEYQQKIVNLPHASTFAKCECGTGLFSASTIKYIEPLAGRNTLEIDRTCVIECGECQKQYVSPWD